MPAVLQQLMRHESIDTTMKYYVGRDADAVADVLWQAAEVAAASQQGTNSSTIGHSANPESATEKPQTLVG